MERGSFLGIGWAFPPTFEKYEETVSMVSGEEDVQQSLNILLTTQLKERVMRSDFGCDLTVLLFENITATLLTKVKDIVTSAILLYEPRIELEEVNFFSDNSAEGTITIEVVYRVRATNSRKNFVFPYYINEGTFLKV